MTGELARLETAMQPLVEKLAQRSRWILPLAQDQMEHDELDALVVALADLARNDPPGLLADVRRRLAEADTLRARTVDAHEEIWRRAAAALRASPAYAGLDLRPQVGLVPLGADPRSGMHEFAHLQTGAIPARASDGDLRIDEATGVVLVLVPSGSFAMGAVKPSPERSKGSPNADPMALRSERPVHSVTLSPFFLSKYEMTQGQWLRLTGENPSAWPVGSRAQGRQVTLLNPVESIAWDPCRQVLRRVGLTLPTEAQWEYATRAGTTTPWWTGEMPREVMGALNIADLAVIRNGEAWASKAWDELDDGYVVHAPCGTFPPNPWGFHETLGNVREWTLDRFGFYEAPVRPGDGLRLEFFDPELIVTRGASYSGRLPTSRVSYRGSTKAQLAETWVGVRPARALDR
jgi:formylglycine-generating enzyme required for sulfatase activity